jgi:UrcA family protein
MDRSINMGLLIICLVTSMPDAYAQTKSTDHLIQGQRVVRYGDLDLANVHDARKLLRRIDRAADSACGGQPPISLQSDLPQASFNRCHADAVARAVADLGAPLVTRIYDLEWLRTSARIPRSATSAPTTAREPSGS